jgi:hypothetical protein
MLDQLAAPVAADATGAIATVVGLVTALVGLGAALLNARRRPPPEAAPTDAPRADDLLPPRRALVNRDDVLRDAAAMIRAGDGLVAIEGEAGIGKSAVAFELSRGRLFLPIGDEGQPRVWTLTTTP